MAKRIVVFGDVIDDIVAVPSIPVRPDTDTPSQIRHRAGGSAANAAAWLGHLGAQVDFVGRVGAGDELKHAQHLIDAKVTPRLTVDAELPTGTIVVIVDGDRRTMYTDRGANANLTADDVTDELLDAAAVVHFTGYSVLQAPSQDANRRLIARANERGVAVSVDPASAGFIEDFGAEKFLSAIEGATILFPNLDEGRVLTGRDDPLQMASELGKRFPIVALTQGHEGVVLAHAGFEPIALEAVPARLVDPTGAGDAFSAGFLAAWVENGDPLSAAESGVRAAARAVTNVGARPPV
ncbi:MULTISPECIES: PfkB family carbohydrate kinase [unclassified Cryobacterium]|uniref:PfkB family carbohydrate kinase n=1 Tax=unclassified Cryobacterium TaxID=2649013 RepID=UPI001445E5CE